VPLTPPKSYLPQARRDALLREGDTELVYIAESQEADKQTIEVRKAVIARAIECYTQRQAQILEIEQIPRGFKRPRLLAHRP